MTIGQSSVDMSLWARYKLSLCVCVYRRGLKYLCIALRRMDLMGSVGGRQGISNWSFSAHVASEDAFHYHILLTLTYVWYASKSSYETSSLPSLV